MRNKAFRIRILIGSGIRLLGSGSYLFVEKLVRYRKASIIPCQKLLRRLRLHNVQPKFKYGRVHIEGIIGKNLKP
jgi:hypothetical protein